MFDEKLDLKREKKKTKDIVEERGGEKSPPASCKHAVARQAVQHFQNHSPNNANYQPKTC